VKGGQDKIPPPFAVKQYAPHIHLQLIKRKKKGNLTMKKLVSLLTAVLLVLTLVSSVVVFAEDLGSITINGIGEDAKYDIYKILDLESYNTATGVYSYMINTKWSGFFETTAAQAYVTVDESGYATWVAADNDATVAAFAKIALAYAKDNGITADKSSETPGDFVVTGTTGKFSDLTLGYYLVDSSVGALCGLTTTNPNASINAKNGTPTIDKQVKEDSTENWGDSNTADIGQTVEFRTTINVHAGAENYVLHDKMSAGLTFKGVTAVEHIVPGEGTTIVDPAEYTVKTTGITDGCTFEVVFSQDFCNSLETNDKVIVYYNAMLNRNALISSDNPNEAWLEYGEENFSTHDTTNTRTFGFDLVKTDSQNVLIDGAEFKIYDAATGGSEVKVVLMDDGETYRRAREDETGVSIVVKDGKVRVVGFDNGTYYLEETVTPTGYNKLAARQKFIISDSNLDATFNDGIFSTGSGVHVVNKSGSILPETGGTGTTLFIVIGGAVVLMAGVLLFAKKRMSQIAE